MQNQTAEEKYMIEVMIKGNEEYAMNEIRKVLQESMYEIEQSGKTDQWEVTRAFFVVLPSKRDDYNILQKIRKIQNVYDVKISTAPRLNLIEERKIGFYYEAFVNMLSKMRELFREGAEPIISQMAFSLGEGMAELVKGSLDNELTSLVRKYFDGSVGEISSVSYNKGKKILRIEFKDLFECSKLRHREFGCTFTKNYLKGFIERATGLHTIVSEESCISDGYEKCVIVAEILERKEKVLNEANLSYWS